MSKIIPSKLKKRKFLYIYTIYLKFIYLNYNILFKVFNTCVILITHLYEVDFRSDIHLFYTVLNKHVTVASVLLIFVSIISIFNWWHSRTYSLKVFIYLGFYMIDKTYHIQKTTHFIYTGKKLFFAICSQKKKFFTTVEPRRFLLGIYQKRVQEVFSPMYGDFGVCWLIWNHLTKL